MTTLVCSDRALLDLIGEDAAQQQLDDLGLTDTPQVRMLPIPLHVSEPLRQCLSSGCSGPLNTLYAQSKILEYLWKLATFTKNAKVPSRSGTRGVATLRALHDYLTHLEGDMPTLKELGQKFGESPQSLNKGFMREYGQSIFSMVTSHRLGQAHKALQEGSLPIKTIAMRMGYSHVNHFTHAFKMRYGYTPGSLRRKPQELDQNL
jgi:AraC-like DNA-binding protein